MEDLIERLLELQRALEFSSGVVLNHIADDGIKAINEVIEILEELDEE